MKPRYSGFWVGARINVSSSSDYFIDVSYLDKAKRVGRDYDLRNGYLLSNASYTFDVSVPIYVFNALDQLVIEKLKEGCVFYEYDRDGNERYQNLRYRYPDDIAYLIGLAEHRIQAR